MRTFTVFRPNVPETHGVDRANEPDKPQFQGVVFDSGKCVIHWLTSSNSIAVFDSYDEMYRIHGHPEYGTIIKWVE